jgi:hypothetical protein
MVTGGFFDYQPASRRYTLPAAYAALLAGDRAANVAPMAAQLRALAGALPELEQCLAEGGGLARAAFTPHFAAADAGSGDSWRRIYDEQLVDGFIGAVGGLPGRLEAGARVLDLGCGTGHAVNVLARAFPRSCFTGVDISADAIALAEAERAGLGLANAAFEEADAARFQPGPAFDVIMAFDAVHDQREPDRVLRQARAALAPGGVFVMVDAKFSSQLENNVGNPFAPLCYAISLLYCTPVSLADGGAGLGAMRAPSWPARCSPTRASAMCGSSTHRARRTASTCAGPDRGPHASVGHDSHRAGVSNSEVVPDRRGIGRKAHCLLSLTSAASRSARSTTARFTCRLCTTRGWTSTPTRNSCRPMGRTTSPWGAS